MACLQVDLSTASLRPGRDSAWLGALTQRVMANVAASEAHITVHSSSWLHDLDQVMLRNPLRQQYVLMLTLSSARTGVWCDLAQVLHDFIAEEDLCLYFCCQLL